MFTSRRFVTAGIVLAMGAIAIPAMADNDAANSHWYLKLGAGYQQRGSAHEKTGSAALTFDPGFDVNTAVGYKFKHFRVEAESSYFNNSNNVAAVTGVFAEKASGNVGVQTYMMNVYHDFDLHKKHSEEKSKWSPYLGAGLGFMQSSINSLATPTLLSGVPNPAGGFFLNPNSIISATGQWDLAWQFGVGANYKVDDKTSAYIGYRYEKGNGYFRFDTTAFGTFRPNAAAFDVIEAGVRVKI